MYCDNGHFCPRCWLDQKLADLRRGMLHLLPLGYRHRRIMRQAMALRRLHRENPDSFLLNPRIEQQHRRWNTLLERMITAYLMTDFPTFVPTKEQEAFYEGR